MNAAAVLALLADLYQQVCNLQTENEQLRAELADRPPAEPPHTQR